MRTNVSMEYISLITFSPHKNPEKLVLFSPFYRLFQNRSSEKFNSLSRIWIPRNGSARIRIQDFLTQKPVFHPQHQFHQNNLGMASEVLCRKCALKRNHFFIIQLLDCLGITLHRHSEHQ